MTTEARERLIEGVAVAMYDQLGWANDGPWSEAASVALDAILTDYDALAALVDWPELLAAGERVGALRHTGGTDCYRQPNGADAPTEQESE